MAKNENKTQPNEASVADFIAAVPDPRRRAEADAVDSIMRRVSGHEPAMWGPSIIGYGSYHYRYDSGREGTMCRIGFSPRKAQLVVYIVDGFPGHADLLARLGKHKTGKSCLYLSRLDSVDMAVFEELCAASWAEMARRYPA